MSPAWSFLLKKRDNCTVEFFVHDLRIYIGNSELPEYFKRNPSI